MKQENAKWKAAAEVVFDEKAPKIRALLNRGDTDITYVGLTADKNHVTLLIPSFENGESGVKRTESVLQRLQTFGVPVQGIDHDASDFPDQFYHTMSKLGATKTEQGYRLNIPTPLAIHGLNHSSDLMMSKLKDKGTEMAAALSVGAAGFLKHAVPSGGIAAQMLKNAEEKWQSPELIPISREDVKRFGQNVDTLHGITSSYDALPDRPDGGIAADAANAAGRWFKYMIVDQWAPILNGVGCVFNSTSPSCAPQRPEANLGTMSPDSALPTNAVTPGQSPADKRIGRS